MTRISNPRKGFTLIELMVVVMILSALAAMIVPRFAGRTEESKRAAARADIEGNIASALDLFELDNGFYPTTEQGLAALCERPASPPLPRQWKGPYVKKKQFHDPWGHAYLYRSPGAMGSNYDLWSMGPDGMEGGDDDLGNGAARAVQ